MANERVTPKQARGVTTWNRIVEAANTVYERRGRDYLKTQEVQKESGVSIGSIYRYFPDRVGLLAAVMEYRKEQGLEVEPQVLQVASETDGKAQAALETIEAIKDWCANVIEKGEGQYDIKIAGEFILAEITKRGL